MRILQSDVLILGETGLLGSAFVRFFKSNCFSLYRTVSRNSKDIKLDLTNAAALTQLLFSLKPKYIINCAADLSSNITPSASLKSWSVNTELLNSIVSYCKANNAKLLHVSTDQYYVNGENKLHDEDEAVVLKNTYAVQKYLAERISLLDSNSLILRTSFVGFRKDSSRGLLAWLYQELYSDNITPIFSDAWTTSLHVDHLVEFACCLLFEKNASGIYNLGTQSAYTKAMLFLRISERAGISNPKYILTQSRDIDPEKPRSLGLECSRVQKILGRNLPSFEETVTKIITDIKGGRYDDCK